MTDLPDLSLEPSTAADDDHQRTMAFAIYVLYLAGLVFGITFVVGVVLAYIYRGDAPDWLAGHFRFQIRTFWMSLLAGVVAVATSILLVGYLVAMLWVIWLVARCGRGLKLLSNRRRHPEPATWVV